MVANNQLKIADEGSCLEVELPFKNN